MATDNKQIQDPREIGTKGLSGLSHERPDNLHFGTSADEYRILQNFKNKNASPVEYLGNYYPEAGSSKYDTEVESLTDLEDLNEFRAQTQPWYDQIANGALKMVTTAATTFVDGTLGTLMGLGTGVANLMDDDPSTGFWRGMWDNAVTNAMADINENMEKVATNYRSEWENNANVFERMFSSKGAANFWGDDILKNAGFTIGAAASIWATNGVGGALKGVGLLGKLGKGLGLVRAGEAGLEATKAGKVASWLAKTFVSTQGEASIEALNAMRESEKELNANLEARLRERQQDAAIEYQLNVQSGMNPIEAEALYNERLEQLAQDAEAYKKEMQMQMADAGNMIYAANIAALSISNNLTLGSMIRGGYGNAKSLLSQAVKTAEGKQIQTAEEAGKALLKGNLRLEAPEVNNKIAKALGHWALESSQEGLEEGVQNLASNTGQIMIDAKMNKWAKDNTMLGTMINPDATEDLINYSAALGKAYEEQFGSINSPGWTEVMAGFLTGALGVASVHRNEQGQIRPTWQGGLRESFEYVNGNRDAVAKQAEMVNKALTDHKFGERVKHAVQQIAIKKGQDKALEEDDTKTYKNLEVQQVLSDAIFFRDMGMLDDYLASYQAMANGITDQDVAELKAAAKSEDGKASALEGKTDEEIKTMYQDKARSTIEKVKQALSDYEALENQYGNKFSNDTRDMALMEMSYLDTLYWDTQRRSSELEEEAKELENKEKRTPVEDLKLMLKKEALKELDKQAVYVRDTLNEYKNSPDKLEKKVKDTVLKRQKEELYKQADKALAKYKEASTLKDIVDVYEHSPKGDREAVLNQAIEQSKDDTKEQLIQFRNYMGDVNTLEHVIDEKFPKTEEGYSENDYKNSEYHEMLDVIVYEMLHADSPTITRETVKEKLQERKKALEESREENEKEAKGVTIEEDGSLNFEKAFDEGSVTDDDFDDILDDTNTGASHREIKEGSNADKMATAAQNVVNLNNLITDMDHFIDSLDKLDELREAAKKKEEKRKKSKKEKSEEESKKTKKEGKHLSYSEEALGADPNEGEDEEGGDDFFDEKEEPETKKPKTDTSKTKPKKESKLKEEEQAYYKEKEKTGKSGVVYTTIQKKNPKLETPKKIKDSLIKRGGGLNRALEDYMEDFEKAKTDKDKKEIINHMIDLINSSISNNKTIELTDEFFKKNSAYLKPDSAEEGSLPPHTNKDSSIEDSDTSMNGNQSPAYVMSELNDKSKMVKITRQKSGATPVQVWLESNGFNVQEIIDNYLGRIVEADSKKDVADRTKVHYLHSTEQPNVVFLAMKYSDIQSIVKGTPKKTVTAQNGDTYVIIGTFGYERARTGTQDMYNTILDNLKNGEHTSEGWHVDTEHTNRIKDIEAGKTVKQTLKDDVSEVRDLRDLLNDPERNPYNLSLEDLSWTVIEGKEDAPKLKIINGRKSDTYGINGGRPGQVYLNIPASNGKTIPMYMETIFLNELEEGTPLMDEIVRLVNIIGDRESTMQDKKSAIANLTDLLVFSPHTNQIHLNDEANKLDPNTVYVTENGIPRKVIDFEDDEYGTTEDLLNAVLRLNPRINISTTVLDRDASIYLDSGVFKTDVAMLGTVNSRFFVYPVDDEGNYVKNKPFKGLEVSSYDGSTRNRIIIGGKTVFYDGKNFTDQAGNPIKDTDGTFKIAAKIKQGKIKPIEIRKNKYYDVDGVMYADNGHGGLNILDNESRDNILEAQKKKDKGTRKKANVEKKVKEVKKKEENSSNLDDYLSSISMTVESGRTKDKYYSDRKDTDLLSEMLKPKDNFTINRTSVKKAIDLIEKYPGLLVWHLVEKDGKFSIMMQRENDEYWNTPEDLEALLTKEKIDPSIFGIDDAGDSKGTPSNFTNGTNIDDVKSQEDINSEKDKDNLSNILSDRANKEKRKSLYNAIEEKFGKRPDNIREAIAALVANHIDITSNDLDTIEGLVKCHH